MYCWENGVSQFNQFFFLNEKYVMKNEERLLVDGWKLMKYDLIGSNFVYFV